MKTLLILFLIISTLLVVGCGTQVEKTSGVVDQSAEVTQEEALEEIDNSIIAETDEVEIGEMI